MFEMRVDCIVKTAFIVYLSMEHVFWPYDTERRIKLTFSESVSLSLKTRLMTLLNMPQETSLKEIPFRNHAGTFNVPA